MQYLASSLIQRARELPLWAWAVPGSLLAGFLVAFALFYQPGAHDEPVVHVKTLGARVEHPAEPDRIVVAPPPDPPRRRHSRRRKTENGPSVARAAHKAEPEVSPIAADTHFISTVASPAEVGALRPHVEAPAPAPAPVSAPTSDQ